MLGPLKISTPMRREGKPETPETLGKYRDNGTLSPVASLVKIKRGNETAAIERLRADGLDNVAFKLGDDLYVASGREMLARVYATRSDSRVTYGGKAGSLVAFDDQPDNLLKPDSLLRRVARASAGAAGMGAVAGLGGGVVALMVTSGGFTAFGAGFALFGLGAAALTWLKQFPSRAYLTPQAEGLALQSLATLGEAVR